MKTAVVYQKPHTNYTKPAFPNAATRRQAIHQLVDLALVIAIGLAFSAIVLFLPVLA